MYVLYYNAIFHSHLGVFLLPHGSVTLLLLHLCVAGVARTILTALDARRDILLGLFFPKRSFMTRPQLVANMCKIVHYVH